jgi:hypothetical protein
MAAQRSQFSALHLATADAGEFLRLLRELAPDEEKFYAEGAEEVEEEIKKTR